MYFYRVKACNDIECSNFSDENSGYAGILLGKPSCESGYRPVQGSTECVPGNKIPDTAQPYPALKDCGYGYRLAQGSDVCIVGTESFDPGPYLDKPCGGAYDQGTDTCVTP